MISKGDKKQTFKLLNNMIGKTKKHVIPDNNSEINLCKEFEQFFMTKINTIRNNIDTSSLSENDYPDISTPYNDCIEKLSKFSVLTSDDLTDVLNSLSNKHCELDLIPTPLYKTVITRLSSYILHIINTTLSLGIFPAAFKKALVKPVLKNSDLDKNILSNYRPISNLCFLSKLIEKCVLKQLLHHLSENDLFGSFQSAYRQFHSCETAITKITNDILVTLDNNEAEFLIFLDLISAFDTVDHSVLLKKLNDDFYINDTVLCWFKSYLSDRSYSVKIGFSISDGTITFYGVPQGSILGPVLFLLYIAEIENIAKIYGFKIHLYADDMQIYISFQHTEALDSISSIEHCLRHIKLWMSKHFLKINESKTKLMLISSKRYSNKALTDICLSFGGSLIFPSLDAANLGVTFDHNMSMTKQINSVTSKGYFYLNNFYRVADKLTIDLKVQLITTFILPLVDYCNVVYTCASRYYCQKLQKLLNSAVRFIFNLTGKKKHRLSLTPYFMKLHILPIDYRIKYKVCLLVYKCIHGSAPSYLSDLISHNVVCSSLRSSSDFYSLHITIPNSTYEESAFSYFAPYHWNMLPVKVRESPSVETFKTTLKTHLYRQCYGTN